MLVQIMGAVDIIAGLMIFGTNGDLGTWIALALFFKGGISLLSFGG